MESRANLVCNYQTLEDGWLKNFKKHIPNVNHNFDQNVLKFELDSKNDLAIKWVNKVLA